tara:strand:- start:453 stop:731 length:279 start_codon:yes stop_codon:yes gene_type:complete
MSLRDHQIRHLPSILYTEVYAPREVVENAKVDRESDGSSNNSEDEYANVVGRCFYAGNWYLAFSLSKDLVKPGTEVKPTTLLIHRIHSYQAI